MPAVSSIDITVGDGLNVSKNLGLFAHTLFYPYNHTTSMYHSTYPQNHHFGTSDNTITYKLSDDITTISHVTNVLPVSYTRKVFGYSKLYHQSFNLYLRDYQPYQDASGLSEDGDYIPIIGCLNKYDQIDIPSM